MNKRYTVKLIYPNGMEKMVDGAIAIEYLDQGKIRIETRKYFITYYGFYDICEEKKDGTLAGQN